MASNEEEIAVVSADEEEEELASPDQEWSGLTLAYLIDRLGPASGTALFERVDPRTRSGERVLGTTVRAARKSFSAAGLAHHARLVVPRRGGRAPETDGDAEKTMVMIALEDLEAVVKAARADFDWTVEFSPRRDLPVATTSLVVRSGNPGRRTLTP